MESLQVLEKLVLACSPFRLHERCFLPFESLDLILKLFDQFCLLGIFGL